MTRPTTNQATTRGRPRTQHVLEVESTQQLGPQLVRVIVTGESLGQFTDNGYTDSYVKLLFIDSSLGLEPPYDVASLRQTLPAAQQPVTRTYTVRWVDRIAKRLAIDFVVHGDTGVAAPWAAGAAVGDRLVLSGPGGGFAPDPSAAWHVFVGDLSALPAIAAAVESLPATARGMAHLEISSTEDVIDIANSSQLKVHWLVNPDPSNNSFLADALDNSDWPSEFRRGPPSAGLRARGTRVDQGGSRRPRPTRDSPRRNLHLPDTGLVAAARTNSRPRNVNLSARSTDITRP